MLTVTLVSKLDHAGHLGVHIGVNLGLGSRVGADYTGGAVNIVVYLGDLLLDLGTELKKTDLELSGGRRDLVGGLGASGG